MTFPRSRQRIRVSRSRIRGRAMVAFGLVSLLLSATLALVAYSLVRSSLIEDRQQAAMVQAYTNARIVRSRVIAGDIDITTLLSGLRMASSGDVLLRRSGRWYASSVTADRASLPASLRRGVDAGRAGSQFARSPSSAPVLVLGVPIAELDGVYFEVKPLDDLQRTLRVLGSSLAFAALAAAVVGAASGAVISGRVVRPLRSVSAVAREIAAGRLDARLDAATDRDLEPLAESFNDMVDKLDERARREARFASDVSHDLRGPLTALSAAVSVVNRRRDQLPAEAVAAVDSLDVQIQSFSRLVVDLLEISRFEAGTAELATRLVSPVEFMRAVVADHGREVAVAVEGADPPPIEIDPRRLRRALINVLENADRYAGGATAITIAATGDTTVRIMVDDDGPGIPEGERESIFSRYHRGRAGTAAAAPTGTGLGLALARQHVELHGGRIWVEPAPSGGARFIVELEATPS